MVSTKRRSGVAKSSPKKKSAARTAISLPPRAAVEPKPSQKCRVSISEAPKMGNHIMFIFVGPQRELCTVYSAAFPASTKAYIEEKNQGQRAYRLPEQDPAIFEIYRLFLYTRNICTIGDGDQDRPDNGRYEAHLDAEWVRLAHCYFLGKSMRDEAFCNSTITALVEKVNETERFPSGIATEVYGRTEAGDCLRSLIVDLHVYYGKGSCIQPPHEDADGPREFLQDVIRELAVAGGDIHRKDVWWPWDADGCAYHVHRVSGKCTG